MSMISVEGLTKYFGEHVAVNGLSLEVQKGEVFGFLGPNGCGKTTTIRMLCGLLQPDGGQGSCLGLNLLTQSDKISLKVGYMPQHFCYYKDLTVKENLVFIAKLYAAPMSRVDQLISDYKLKKYQNYLAKHLSGGWKQRLSLVASMINDPQLLILDEPTAAVDPSARREFWSIIHEFADAGKSVLVSTHYMDEAVRCTRMAFMLDGGIRNSGTCEQIIKDSKLNLLKVISHDVLSLKVKLNETVHSDNVKVSLYGNAIHISSSDKHQLNTVMDRLSKEGYECQWGNVGVEDIFVHYVG